MGTHARKYDCVIMGATGFTGQLAAQYMARAYGSPATGPVKWAIAGRSAPKLQAVVASLEPPCEVDSILFDASDLASVEDVIQNTRVVANYAGTPFIDKALPIVELCAKHGTCYTDITGETPLHRASYDKFHAAAKASGAIVLHGCGFDSVPSDMGAFLAAEAMRTKHGCKCSQIKTIYGDSAGFVSGGTLATAVALVGEGDSLPGAKEARARGSYALDPEGASGGLDTGDLGGRGVVSYDHVAKTWVAPFVMAAVNAPVVRKSNALSGYSYGERVRYSEVMATGSFGGSVLTLLGLVAFGAALFVSPLRWLLLRTGVMPKPGEGPSKRQQDEGYFKTDIYAVAEGSEEGDLVCKVHFNSGTAGDPGYKATALMSMECALALALQRDECSAEGGVLTTATALGDVLIARLNKAGMDIGIDY